MSFSFGSFSFGRAKENERQSLLQLETLFLIDHFDVESISAIARGQDQNDTSILGVFAVSRCFRQGRVPRNFPSEESMKRCPRIQKKIEKGYLLSLKSHFYRFVFLAESYLLGLST
jgi:hypothetical protein